MAIGWDMWLAWVAIKLGIPLHAYIPFIGQEDMWSDEHKKQYHKILKKATLIKEISPPGYAAWKMIKRDKVMVDESECILSLWDLYNNKIQINQL